MKILLTNDDGIDAIGIRSLVDVLKDDYEVYVVAPDQQRSAASHSVSYFWRDHIARKVEIPGVKGAWAIEHGKPADCAFYGVRAFVPDCDLVISGINHGENMSTDCIYSGTVAAAVEGFIAGKPSMATSLCSFTGVEYMHDAAEMVKKVIPWFMQQDDRFSYVLNVNVPYLPKEEIKGFKATQFGGDRIYPMHVDQEPIGENEIRLHSHNVIEMDIIHSDEFDGDYTTVQAGYVSLSPLGTDMVLHDYIFKMKGLENL